MLFKRFESSVAAFCETLKRMIQTHSRFLQALAEGFVPAGEEAEELLGRGGTIDEAEFLEALAAVSGRYDLRDFDAEKLRKHIAADRDLLQTMLDLVEPITPDQDDKLQTLLARLEEEPIRGQKCLIFTQYADTAEYLYRNLNPDGQREIRSSAIVSRRSMTPSARMRRSWM
jgi:hypothetical protein